MRLDDVIKKTDALPFGGTDCALPMLWAADNQVPVDIFCVYTDSETWAGAIHPSQALAAYRQKMGIGAKLVVIGMVSNGFTIADPNDAGMLDVVGFDTADAVDHHRFRNQDVARVMSRRAPVASERRPVRGGQMRTGRRLAFISATSIVCDARPCPVFLSPRPAKRRRAVGVRGRRRKASDGPKGIASAPASRERRRLFVSPLASASKPQAILFAPFEPLKTPPPVDNEP